MPPDEASRCCRPTSTSPRPPSPRSAPTSASGSPRSATSASTSSTRSWPPAASRAASPTSPTSWARSRRWSATSGSIESLIKAGAFDSLGHRRRALVAIHETAVDQYADIKRNEAIGQDSLFGGLDDDDGGGFGVDDRGPRHRRLGQADAARPRAGDARPLRLRPPADGPRARPRGRHRLHDRPAARSTRSAPTASTVTVSGLITSVQRKITKRGDAWAMVTAGGPRGRHRRAAVPQRLPAGQHAAQRGRDRHRQGPAVPVQGPAGAARPGGQRPRPRRRARPVRW